MDYFNKIEVKYRYSQTKAASSIVSIDWMLNHWKNVIASNIRYVEEYCLVDMDDQLKNFLSDDQYNLTMTRHLIRVIFANHKEVLEKALEDGYKFMCVDNIFNHFAVIFMEERYYDF